MGLMLLETRGPALIGLRQKSRFGECDDARAISQAIDGARGTPRIMPVYHGGKIIAAVCGEGHRSPAVWVTTHEPELWCGFTTYAALKDKITAGQYWQSRWQRNLGNVMVTRNWYDLWNTQYVPEIGAYTGSAYTARAFDSSTLGAMWLGTWTSSGTKHLASMQAFSDTGQAVIMLVDRVLTYEACSFNADSNQAMTNTTPATRYIAAGQQGLLVALTCQTLFGATASNLTQMQYTDQDGNATQSMPTSPTVSIIVSAAAPNGTGLGARVVAPATSGNTYTWGPWLPLATGDTGVRIIDNFTTSAANTGTMAYVCVVPLAIVAVQAANLLYQIDQVMFGKTSLARVYDSACLNFFVYAPVTAHTNFWGQSDFVDG